MIEKGPQCPFSFGFFVSLSDSSRAILPSTPGRPMSVASFHRNLGNQMLRNIQKTATAAATALSLAFALPAPAHAWGEKEQNLAALAAAGIIGTVLWQQYQRQNGVAVGRAPVNNYPVYTAPRYQQPTYQQPRYQEPTYQQPRYSAPVSSSVYSTPAARAFNSYSPNERRAIQSRLRQAGYYNGGIDGSFGPMTYRAVMAISRDSTGTDKLGTMGGAFEFYDTILNS